MRIVLVAVFVVAGLFAAGAFYLVFQYIEGAEEDARLKAEAQKPGVEGVEILVADTNLQAGTTIKDKHFKWQPWPDDSLHDDYIVYREDDDDNKSYLEDPVVGMVVRRAIVMGEPITEPKLFERDGAPFLSGMLAPGMRAYTIRVKTYTGVAGFIMPGDRIDVIVSIKWKIDKESQELGLPFAEYTSETVVQNARVMAVDQTSGDLEENAFEAEAITIEVTPKQVEMIAVAMNKGTLSLSLRSLEQGETGSIEGFTADRDTLYAMGGDFPISDRLAEPIIVTAVGEENDARVLPSQNNFPVVTALSDLPPGSLLRSNDLGWAKLADGLAPEMYIIQGRNWIGPNELSGVLLTVGLKAGDPLPFKALISSNQPQFLSAALRSGMRAIPIMGQGGTFAGLPGDQVDVILVGAVEGHRFSETILQRARILIMDDRGNGATIEVSPRQFETIAVAETMGDLVLSLRSVNTAAADIYSGQFTSDLEVSRAVSGGLEAMIAAGVEVPSMEDMIVEVPSIFTNALVAVRDLEVGTLVRDSDFRFSLIEGGVPAGAEYFIKETTNVTALRGALVVKSIIADEVLSADKLMKPGAQGFLATALGGGKRAVSIAVNVVSGVSGFISPGDRVDVLMTHQLSDRGENAVLTTRIYTETILRNLRVLAVEQTVDKTSGQPVIGRTVTMEVLPKEAETLALGARMGELSLVLHGAVAAVDEAPAERRFTSDVEISQATTTFIYGTEPIYAESVATDTSSATAAEAAVTMPTPVIYTNVLVAVRDLPAGTLLHDSDFRFSLIEGGVPADAEYFVKKTTNVTVLRGALVVKDIVADAVLTADMLMKPGAQGFLANVLGPGKRAVSIAVNVVSGVSGFISP
ncbi:MAG: Flp pilus assembly protein CpaB, partial [Alphaproteobacteria bacterium]